MTASASRRGGGLLTSVRSLANELNRLKEVDVSVLALDDDFAESDLTSWAPLEPFIFPVRGPRAFGYGLGMREALVNSNADISTRKRLIRAIEIGEFKIKNLATKSETLPFYQRNVTHLPFSESSQRIHHSPLIFGIDIPVEIRRYSITKRLHDRLQNGMIEEVKSLLESGISAEKLIFYGLEYKFITEYLVGDLSYDEMTKRLEIAIHQFAKRQMTFFRSMERKGIKINWLDGMQPVEVMTTQLLDALNH